MITRLILAILFLATADYALTAGKHEEADFNFDGHADYRVFTLENGKADCYDVYIYDADAKSFIRNEVLSGTINPWPHPTHLEVRCIWPGGHSGNLYSCDVYRWTGTFFEFAYSERQEAIQVDGSIRYVRARTEMRDGKPVITEIALKKDE